MTFFLITALQQINNRIRIINKGFLRLSLGVSIIGLSIPIYAEEKTTVELQESVNGDVTYSASFFEQYLPQNALEMIERLPGFNFDSGSNARGFGGNAGNVLIDGVRPTSKSGGLRSSLVRIPATQVDRIEILRGGVSSGEASGQAIVANVIRIKSGTTGSWALKQRWAPKGSPQPNLEAALATTLGKWDSAFDIDIGAGPGYRTADIESIDADGRLISSAREKLTELGEFGFINAEGVRQFGEGKLTLNARIGGDQYKQNTQRDIFIGELANGELRDEFWQLNIDSKFNMAEFGVDWNETFTEWKWRVIGLGLVEDSEFKNNFHFQTQDNVTAFDSDFSQDARSSETIARTTFSKVTELKFRPEFGLEIAKNKLTSHSLFFQNNLLQELNGGDTQVEELRGEAFYTFNYAATEKLNLEGGLTLELSKIQVSGDAAQKQRFKFIKPRLSATYKFDKKNQLALELERRVGQLDFDDFAVSSQASDDRTTSGNPDLRPDQTTEFAATYDWSFSDRGSLKVRTFYQWKKDILEQLLLPSGGQGIGNAGNAKFWGVTTDLNLPLDFLLENGLIEITHIYRDSRFDDPITNTVRTINGYTPRWLNFLLRQDITEKKLAWGVEYQGHFIDTNYFVDEKQTFEGNNRLRVFIETSQFFGVKIQLEINNINTAEFDRTRFIYEDDRGGIFEKTEIARRLRRPEIKLTFSDNF